MMIYSNTRRALYSWSKCGFYSRATFIRSTLCSSQYRYVICSNTRRALYEYLNKYAASIRGQSQISEKQCPCRASLCYITKLPIKGKSQMRSLIYLLTIRDRRFHSISQYLIMPYLSEFKQFSQRKMRC